VTPKRWRRAAAVLAAALLLVPLFVPAAEDEKPPGKLPPDLALVPRDTLLFATLRVADVVREEQVNKLLLAAGGPDGDRFKGLEGDSGLRTRDIERITLVVRGMASPNGPVLIFRTVKPIDKEAFFKRFERIDETTVHGKKILVVQTKHRTPRATWLADDRTVVWGEDGRDGLTGFLGALALGGKTHALADELTVAAGKHALVVAARPELMFRTMDAERLMAERKAPEKAGGAKEAKGVPLNLRTVEEILNDKTTGWGEGISKLLIRPAVLANRAVVTLDLGETITVAARASFGSVDDRADGEAVARMGLYLLREMFPEMVRGHFGLDLRSKPMAPLLAQWKDAVRSAELKAEGQVLKGSMKGKVDIRPVLKLLAQDAPARTEVRNLVRIGSAFHDHHDALKYFPRAICDRGGKPLLSWRVALLPYLDDEAQEKLYKEFKLDEPWDSPHNKKLIHRMPAVYAAPAVKAGAPEPEAHTTPYQIFTGSGTLFPKPDSKPTTSSITDGVDKTFLVAEAGKPVVWTRPEDIDLDGKTFPKLGGRFEGFFHAVMCAGWVRKVNSKADEKSLRALISPDDGNEPDDKVFRP
jgi:hypothetical protein